MSTVPVTGQDRIFFLLPGKFIFKNGEIVQASETDCSVKEEKRGNRNCKGRVDRGGGFGHAKPVTPASYPPAPV